MMIFPEIRCLLWDVMLCNLVITQVIFDTLLFWCTLPTRLDSRGRDFRGGLSLPVTAQAKVILPSPILPSVLLNRPNLTLYCLRIAYVVICSWRHDIWMSWRAFSGAEVVTLGLWYHCVSWVKHPLAPQQLVVAMLQTYSGARVAIDLVPIVGSENLVGDNDAVLMFDLVGDVTFCGYNDSLFPKQLDTCRVFPRAAICKGIQVGINSSSVNAVI